MHSYFAFEHSVTPYLNKIFTRSKFLYIEQAHATAKTTRLANSSSQLQQQELSRHPGLQMPSCMQCSQKPPAHVHPHKFIWTPSCHVQSISTEALKAAADISKQMKGLYLQGLHQLLNFFPGLFF